MYSEEDLMIDLRGDHPIYVGRFVDRDRPPFAAGQGGAIMKKEIRISGFGGQGVALAGYDPGQGRHPV